MKLSRSELIQALEQVKGAVAQKGFVPILTHVLIEGDSVLGYDSEIGVKAKLTTKVSTPFNLKFTTFLELLRQLEDEDVELEVLPDKVKLSCGRHKSTLAMISEEYPKPVVKVQAGDWKDVPAGFKEALERAMLGVSEDENNRVLSAIYVVKDRVYGGDGKQVVRCSVPGLSVDGFLLPRKAANEVIRLGNPKRVAVRDSVAVFDYVNLTFLARLRDGETYPADQFDKLFTSREANHPLPEGLSTALGRLGLLCGDELKAITMKCLPLGLELSVSGASASGTEMLAPEGVQFGNKGINSALALPLLQYAENWDPGQHPQQLFYLTGETATFEALLAPVLL